MIGHLYTLLFVGGAVAPPATPAAMVSGGWPAFERPSKRREKWREELDGLMAKPAPRVVVQAVAAPVPQQMKAPKLDRAQQAYIDSLFAAIVQAKNEQERARKAAELATAETEAQQAQAMLAQAVEAERVVKQQMMDFDIAFVAAVLADM